MNKDTCLTCVHWNLKDDKNKPHSMARHGFGYCDYDERYRYFSGRFECEKNKYESVDPDLKKDGLRGGLRRVRDDGNRD